MFKVLQGIFDRNILEWISRNRSTFVLIILLFGNIYQFYIGSEKDKRYDDNMMIMNDKLEEANKLSLHYERERSNTLESLLKELVIKYNSRDSSSKK